MKNSNSVLDCSKLRINRCPTFNCHNLRTLDSTIGRVYDSVLGLALGVFGNHDKIKHKLRGLDERHHCFKVTVFLPFYYGCKECIVKCDCNVNQGQSDPDYPFAHNPFNPVTVANYVLSYFGLPLLKDIFGYERFD